MVIRQAPFTATDFNNVLDNYAGRNVVLTPRTQSISNRTGKTEYTDGTETTIYCYFVKRNQFWTFDKSGKIEGGDALLMAKYSDSVQKNDLITADDEIFIVESRIDRVGSYNTDGTINYAYTACNLFKYEND